MTKKTNDAAHGDSENTSPSKIAEIYRRLAVEWASASGDPKRANRLLREHHEYYKRVRNNASGKEAVISLLTDAEPAVRLLAATHALSFDPEQAITVLEDLQQQAGLYGFDALMTLRQFRAGRLRLDW